MYGGILLPPTCKINYVNMQHNYVNMRPIYVDMQHNNVEMQVINFCQKLFISMGNFFLLTPLSDIIHATCNISMFTCDLFMST